MNLSIQNLSVTYPNGVEALKNVSLEISNGMFGLLGPNGAGKSTLMRILATLQQPTSGNIFLNDINLLTQHDVIRQQLGYLPQEFGVYPKVTAKQLLSHLAVLKGVTNRKERNELTEALLIKTNLYEHRNKNMGSYSGGMRQRFGIAQALLTSPNFIIVDEPTAGLDPSERNRFLNLLSELGENTIVILSTHIVEDVKELCTDMAILNRGELLYKGCPRKAISEIDGQVWSKTIEKHEIQDYKSRYHVIYEKMFAGKPEVHIYSEVTPNNGFASSTPDLEDVYFQKIYCKNLKKEVLEESLSS
ncbi:MAG: ABC transporter ATP-binding protein [Bacteroidales bacterium]|nr:MAG: ABC transporter ATP-binding protein [Bacteroidales bacterium]